MLHCLNTSGNLAGSCSDMTVLERQRSRIKFQQQQEHPHPHPHPPPNQAYFSGFNNALFSYSSSLMIAPDSGSSLADVVAPPSIIKPDHSSRFDKFVMGFGSSGLPPPPAPPASASASASASGFDMNSAISRTYSCPPVLPHSNLTTHSANNINSSSSIGKDTSKKRKPDRPHNTTKGVAENDNKDKRIKVGAEDGESKITGQKGTKNNSNNSTTGSKSNTENCADNSKENSKASDQKPDYIHVRARRGQATDSHSLAERVRREKISERMKYLQDLVPGCNKITGKAGMLDEIINYVQSLQRQVEFLSMKLAAVNPRLDFNIDDLFAKEVFPACAASFPAIGMSSSDMANPAYLHFNSPQQQIVSGSGLDTGINPPPDMSLRRSISAPVSLPETFVDSSCFTILPSSTWEGDFPNLYNVAFEQARPAPSFPSQLFTGLVEPSNLKMEM